MTRHGRQRKTPFWRQTFLRRSRGPGLCGPPLRSGWISAVTIIAQDGGFAGSGLGGREGKAHAATAARPLHHALARRSPPFSGGIGSAPHQNATSSWRAARAVVGRLEGAFSRAGSLPVRARRRGGGGIATMRHERAAYRSRRDGLGAGGAGGELPAQPRIGGQGGGGGGSRPPEGRGKGRACAGAQVRCRPGVRIARSPRRRAGGRGAWPRLREAAQA